MHTDGSCVGRIPDHGQQLAHACRLGLHRALGFTDVGTMRSVGWKFGAWRDIVLMEKTLGAGDTTSPE